MFGLVMLKENWRLKMDKDEIEAIIKLFVQKYEHAGGESDCNYCNIAYHPPDSKYWRPKGKIGVKNEVMV